MRVVIVLISSRYFALPTIGMVVILGRPLGLDPNGERRKLVHSSSTGSIRCRQPCCCM